MHSFKRASILLLLWVCLGCQQKSVPPAPNHTSFETRENTKYNLTPVVMPSKIAPTPSLPPLVVKGFIPDRLQIPSIHLDAPVESVGLLPSGEMGVPVSFHKVGLLAPWTKPGENGNAVIAGHIDHKTGPAIFYNLRRVLPGAPIRISNTAGQTYTFFVTRTQKYKTKESPLQQIFGPADKARLNLITCAGKFNKKTKEHSHRLIVFSELQK
jgi:LPXTG-site transpeptidase (sortase) family protein